MELPKYYDKTTEKKWYTYWQEEGIYAFDNNSEAPTFSVDTPPPTVSGKMHVGHAFSYTQEDFIVRFQRMRGKNVFFPFGTDDNGLPTEKLVEKLNSVRATKMERAAFIALCQKTLKEIKPDFVEGWKRIGMSCDFSGTYSTISDYAMAASQKSFIDLYRKGFIYQKEAPTIWDTHFQSAIAQAELEDKEEQSVFHTVQFTLKETNTPFSIGTTRPELIAACVAVFVHPEDQRYQDMIGKTAITPLFKREVPILADASANPEKGTGILMICSYGDRFDVDAIARQKLTPHVVLEKNGKLNEKAGEFCGLTVAEARKAVLINLKEAGLLLDQKQIIHTVNVYEKSGVPIEFIATKQWFIRVVDKKDDFIRAGREITWKPENMRKRYENWVENLNWDWCISRQRPFGVPFPLWYDKEGKVILPDEEQLPIDPTRDLPIGYSREEVRAETDVMDTWATSSITPQLAGNWTGEDSGYKMEMSKVFPYSLRPQAHDIIRTWAFYTIIKSLYHHDQVPWKTIAISGNVADPKGEKMSKSKGNVVDPFVVMEKYNADALRYWAAQSKLGEDLSYQEKDVMAGHKTVNKLWNASKFVLMNLEGYDASGEKELRLVDKWLQAKLHKLIEQATVAFEDYEYAKVKMDVDKFFWQTFCDNYLELIKDRLYNAEGAQKNGVQHVLYDTLFSLLQLFAPLMPFVTEEIYQLAFRQERGEKSIHTTSWPISNASLIDDKAEAVGDVLVALIEAIRKAKSEKQLSMKAPVKQLTFKAELSEEDVAAIKHELETAGMVEQISFTQGTFEVDVAF